MINVPRVKEMRVAKLMALIFLSIPSLALGQDVNFTACSSQPRYHFAVEDEGDRYLIHLHLVASECARQTVFARCRVARPAAPDQEYRLTRRLTIGADHEEWSIYFRAPKASSDVVYQIEVGLWLPTAVNDFQIHNRFSWTFRQGRMERKLANGDEAALPFVIKEVVLRGGEYEIKSSPAGMGAVAEFRYGFAALRDYVDESRAARKQ